MIWSEDARRRWPRPPKGYLYLAEAVNLIGHLLFDGEWSLGDMTVRLRSIVPQKPFEYNPPGPPRSIISSDFARGRLHPSEAEQRRDNEARMRMIEAQNIEAAAHNKFFGSAHDRASEVKRILLDQATAEKMGVLYRSEEDGSLHPVPANFWALWQSVDVFHTCRISDKPWIRPEDRRFPVDLFVSEANLRAIDWKTVTWRDDPQPLDKTPRLSDLAGDKQGASKAAVTDRTGAPGAPSSMHLVESEMRRRHAHGDMLLVLAREAEALAEWFKHQPIFAGLRQPTAKTIKNQLRDLHRTLKQGPTKNE